MPAYAQPKPVDPAYWNLFACGPAVGPDDPPTGWRLFESGERFAPGERVLAWCEHGMPGKRLRDDRRPPGWYDAIMADDVDITYDPDIHVPHARRAT